MVIKTQPVQVNLSFIDVFVSVYAERMGSKTA